MSRKEVNRYYPPDVDPSKVKFSQKQRKSRNVVNIRLMVPFSIKCLNCNEYISQRRKFNARKEVTDRNYLSISIIKFTFRCPRCAAELSFETDPQNGDYKCIKGCKKNYEKDDDNDNNGKVKKNETVDEMISRLDKEFKENEKMKKDMELREKKGLDGKIDNLSNDNAMEQLEKRLEEQQREQERIEELEDLQEHLGEIERKRMILEDNGEENNDKEGVVEDDSVLVKEAKNAFKKHQNTKRAGIFNGYSDSSDDDEEVDTKVIPQMGIVKKRKIRIVR